MACYFPLWASLRYKSLSQWNFLLQNDETPVVWRGPLKMRLIKQFLSDAMWGEVDYLFIDLPPGTGDEPLSVRATYPRHGWRSNCDHARALDD